MEPAHTGESMMSVNFPVIGVGVTVGSMAPLLAPFLEPVVRLVAEAQPPAGLPPSSVYFGLGAIIATLGTAVIQPWLKERGTAEKLTISMRQNDEYVRDNGALRGKISSLEATLAAKDIATGGLIEQLTEATEKNLKLADRNIRVCGLLLTMMQRATPLSEAVRAAAPDPSAAGHRVLVVEDDPVARTAMAEMLESLGFAVTAVDNAGDAHDALDAAPEAVVLDLMLPGGSGDDVLRAIRDRGLATRVVVTTGRSEGSLAGVRAMLRPGDGLFSRPFDVRDLIGVLRGPPAGAGAAP